MTIINVCVEMVFPDVTGDLQCQATFVRIKGWLYITGTNVYTHTHTHTHKGLVFTKSTTAKTALVKVAA